MRFATRTVGEEPFEDVKLVVGEGIRSIHQLGNVHIFSAERPDWQTGGSEILKELLEARGGECRRAAERQHGGKSACFRTSWARSRGRRVLEGNETRNTLNTRKGFVRLQIVFVFSVYFVVSQVCDELGSRKPLTKLDTSPKSDPLTRMINRRSEHPMPREGPQPGANREKLQASNSRSHSELEVGGSEPWSAQLSALNSQLGRPIFRHA